MAICYMVVCYIIMAVCYTCITNWLKISVDEHRQDKYSITLFSYCYYTILLAYMSILDRIIVFLLGRGGMHMMRLHTLHQQCLRQGE